MFSNVWTSMSGHHAFPLAEIRQKLISLDAAKTAAHIDEKTYQKLHTKLSAIDVRCQSWYSGKGPVLARVPKEFAKVLACDDASALARASKQAQRLDHDLAPTPRELDKLLAMDRPKLVFDSTRFGQEKNLWAGGYREEWGFCSNTFFRLHNNEKTGLSVCALAQACMQSESPGECAKNNKFARLVAGNLAMQIESCLSALMFPSHNPQVHQALRASFNFGWHHKLRAAYVTATDSKSSLKMPASCHVVSVVVHQQVLFVVNLSQNRVYLLKDGKARQVTVDHRRDEEQEFNHILRFSALHFSSRAAKNADSSRLLLDQQPHVAWQPQITQIPLTQARGGVFVIMSQSVAQLFRLSDMQRYASSILLQGDSEPAKGQLLREALNRATDGELGIALFNVPMKVKGLPLWS